METDWTQILSGLIWIQSVRHSDGIPEGIFEKFDFENNQLTTQKHVKFSRGAKSKSGWVQQLVVDYMGSDARKPVYGVSNKVRYKPACLAISPVSSLDMILSNKLIITGLIRLRMRRLVYTFLVPKPS